MYEYSELSHLTVSEAGEPALLAAIFRGLASQGDAPWVRIGPGDDAAVLSLDGDLVITTDAMVHGPDFQQTWTTPRELGWKLAASNLSDVAAMGAWPLGLTFTVMAPTDTTVGFLEEVTRGLVEACAALSPGTRVIGGDLSTSQTLAFAVTAVGEMRGLNPVTRSGARAGDTVAYAGDLGLSGAGLRLLATQCQGSPADQARGLGRLRSEHPALLGAHLTPHPPISLGPVAASAGATAMMDVSDALSLDAARLGRSSGVTVNLRSSLLGEDVDMALFGGEDHGLLATFGSQTPLPEGFRVIGEVVERNGELLLDGVACEPRGWDPFKH